MQLAGQLSEFSNLEQPPLFLEYNHNDIDTSIDEIFKFIDPILDNVVDKNKIYPFDNNKGVFSLLIHENMMHEDNLRLIIKKDPQWTQAQFIEWIQSAVISSKSYLNHVEEARTLGIRTRSVQTNIPWMYLWANDSDLYVTLNTSEGFFSMNEELYLFNPSCFTFPEKINCVCAMLC